MSIKNPTLRKVRNRSYTPVRYLTKHHGYQRGWLTKRGRKLLHVYLIPRGRVVKLPLAEERYMTELVRGEVA